MKKIKYLLMLILLTFASTGCIKMNAELEVKPTKKAIYKITYAMDEDYLNGQDLIDDEAKAKLKKNGVEIEKYKKDGYEGYILTKEIKNIDDVSSTKKVTADIFGYVDDVDSDGDKELFTVKKGFFKNTYTANMTFDTSEYNDILSDDDDDYDDDFDYDDEDYSYDYNDEDGYVYDNTSNDDDESIYGLPAEIEDDEDDFGNMDLSGMDIKFSVKLPYGSKSNNATSEKDKVLTWNLMSDDFKGSIKYEFVVYNLPACIGTGVVLLVLIGVGVFFIIKKKKGNKNTAVEAPVVEPSTTLPTDSANVVPTTNTGVVTPTEAPSVPVVNIEPTIETSMNTATPTVEPTAVDPTVKPANDPILVYAPPTWFNNQTSGVNSGLPASTPSVPVVNNEPTVEATSTPVVNNEPTVAAPSTPVVNNEPTVIAPTNNNNNIG